MVAQALTVPERLEWLLKQRGISQNALARHAGVSPQTVANTLRHGRTPQTKTIAKFARTLGVPTSALSPREELSESDLKRIVAEAGDYQLPDTGGRRGGGRGSRARAASSRRQAANRRKPAARRSRTAAAAKPEAATEEAAPTTAHEEAKLAPARRRAAASRGRKPAAGTSKRGRQTRRGDGPSVGEQILARVNELVEKGSTAKAAFDVVARERDTTAGNVQHQYYRMKRKAGEGARTIVRHGASAARSARAAGGAALSAAGNGGAPTPEARGLDIDYQAVIERLEALCASSNEEISLDACKTLLSLRR